MSSRLLNQSGMKINLTIILSFTVVLIAGFTFNSCQLITLEEPLGDIDIFEPTTIPDSIADFNEALHGGSAKSWKCASFTLAGLEGIQDCRLDDIIIIKADGTYSYDGGVVLCGAEDDQRIRNGTWEVINGGRSILFDKDFKREYSAAVVGLEQSTLSLTGGYLGLSINGIYTSN